MSKEPKVRLPHVFEPELLKTCLGLLTPPFRYSWGYVWGSAHERVLDECGSAPHGAAAQIRGWGRLSYMTEFDPAKMQDELGHMYAQALTEYWDRQQNTLTVVLPGPGVQCPELEQFADYLIANSALGAKFGRFSRGDGPNTSHRWYELEIQSLGINTSLWEGDIITLLQGRINIQRKPIN